MFLLKKIVAGLAFASAGIGLFQTYLKINKLWVRKHEKAVAESISVYASILGLLTSIPFLIHYSLVVSDYSSAMGTFLGIVTSGVLLLIGAGFWANRKTRESLWSSVKKALKLEQDEIGEIIKSIARPQWANEILSLLQDISLIDDKLDEREAAFMASLAHAWRLPWTPPGKDSSRQTDSREFRLIRLRNDVLSYLKKQPPVDQMCRVRDLIEYLVNIDKNISVDEKMILDELTGQFDAAINRTGPKQGFQVLIMPQDPEQDDMIANLTADARKVEKGKIHWYVAGTYFSESFSRMVCKKYRALNLFAAVEIV